MPRYNVTLPLTGWVTFHGVEANDPDAAIAAARTAGAMGHGNVSYGPGYAHVELVDSNDD